MTKNNTGYFAGIRTLRVELPVVSPACYSPSRNTIYINPTTFDVLSPKAQTFVLCHEAGHAKEVSEYLADWEGFKRFVSMGYTPRDAVEAIDESLSMTTPEQQNRFVHFVFNAACFDAAINNNHKILREIMRNPNFEQFNERDVRLLTNRLTDCGVCTTEEEVADFLGMSEEKKAAKDAKKAAKQAKKDQKAANKQAKQQAKIDKQNAKNQVILSRAAKNNAKAEGIANGTYQGAGAAIKDTIGSAISTVGSIFGARNNDEEEDYTEIYDENGEYIGSTETKSAAASSSKKWIIIGIVAALVIGLVVFLILRSKKKKK